MSHLKVTAHQTQRPEKSGGTTLAEKPQGKGLPKRGQEWPKSLGTKHPTPSPVLPDSSSSGLFGMLKTFPPFPELWLAGTPWKRREEKPHDLIPYVRMSLFFYVLDIFLTNKAFLFLAHAEASPCLVQACQFSGAEHGRTRGRKSRE